MKKRYNKDIDKKFNEIFNFTKDRNDMVEYSLIMKSIEDMDLNKQEICFHLKYNYCMPKKNKKGKHCYWGLTIRTIND
jgi:hypothetical protein